VIAFSAAPASAAPAAARLVPAQSAASSLARAYEAGHRLPASAVGGVRAGTLHTGTSGGHEWAIASFAPAKSVTSAQSVAFQDGAASGVFEKTGGAWHLVRSGSTVCGEGLPAALKTAWHITAPASLCATSAASQHTAAQQALAALPVSARAAASAADKSLAAAATAKTGATVPPATDPADFGQTIAAIALSQVGHSDNPVVANFNGVDCDPYSTMVAGFSADSDGCGYDSGYNVENENETWCSDFAKWVWERSGITADIDTINAGAVSFYQWATENGQSPEPDTGTPQVGDAVLFFNKSSFPSFADHVGLVTAVHSDGSIDMVNGDFSGGPDISAQYDQDITNLATFAQQSEDDSAEEWVLVSPPTTAQAPAPTGQMTGPSVAVAGTTGHFHASGTVQGSSVDAYYWTFGDSRTTNASGPDVTHAFSEPGTYTVAVTITSAAGTAVTLHQNVHVVAPSAAVASAPDDGIWYDPLPVEQYTFTRSAGGLAEDAWNGGSWLQLSVPGDPSATGNITTLNYPDAANADNMTPHAFFRASDGSLAETYQATSGWVTQDLPGSPAAGGTIVATNTPGGRSGLVGWGSAAVNGDPEVFFVDKSGELAETWLSGSTWRTTALGGGPVASPSSLALTDTVSGPVLFADGPAGTILTAAGGRSWTGVVPALASAHGALTA
ncbi:MAG: PKD domain-containing protein, partial [Trebonia sp.]